MNPQCTDGCLKCSLKKCIYCDVKNNYKLTSGACEKLEIPDCKMFNNDGKCVLCMETFNLDLNTRKCIKIVDSLVENCADYTGQNICGVCKVGFYLQNAKCHKIDNPIENCDVENSNALCILCKPAFVLSVDQKSCVEDPKEENCATYSNMKCDSCSTGFVRNENYYLENLMTFISSSQRETFTQREIDIDSGKIDLKKYSQCQSIAIQNCMLYKSFNKCRICAPSYYVNVEGLCELYPIDSILNCEKYTSLTLCRQCKPGFWIDENGVCHQVKPIPHCVQYNSEPMRSNCVKCSDTHFLQDQNKCVERKFQVIQNCVKMISVKEGCEICAQNYVQSSCTRKCLQQVENCQDYLPSNHLTVNHECFRCKETFYLDEKNQCVQGSVENCQYYEKGRNVCQKCQNKFYLENQKCLAHEVLLNCDVYHPKYKNVCHQCNHQTFLFYQNNRCLEIEEVTNCDEYRDEKNCFRCKDGYYLANPTLCELIPPFENCLQRERNKCGKCIKDFVLQDGVCRDPLDYIVNECELNNVDGMTNYDVQRCFFCKKNSVPFNFRDSYICVESEYMQLLQNKQNLDPNCLQYTNSPDYEFSCSRCKFPKINNDGVCVDECPQDKTLYKQILKIHNLNADIMNESYSIDKVNVCGTKILNCRVASPDLHQAFNNKIVYGCIVCDNGIMPEIQFNKNKVMIRDPFDSNDQLGSGPVSFYPSVKCLSTTDVVLVGEVNVNTKLIDNCQYYTDLGFTKGCTKCKHGYSGIVVDIVHKCLEYKNNNYTCQKCLPNFYLKTPHECKQVQDVPNCVNYNQTSDSTKCIECQNRYYVNGNHTCTLRNVSLDILNCTPVANSDTCNCITDYFNKGANNDIQCVQKPSNCTTAAFVNNVVQCQLCDDSKSFKVSETCQLGTKSKCAKYKADQDFCLECDQTYYVSEGNCVAHDAINLCTEYDKNVKNKCLKCNKLAILFDVKNKCIAVTPIDHCLEYNSTTTCKKCVPGKRLENLSTRCIAIPTSANCLVHDPIDIHNIDFEKLDNVDILDSGEFLYTCTKCKLNYFQIRKDVVYTTTKQIQDANGQTINHPENNNSFESYSCVQYLNYISENCSQTNIDGKIGFQNSECEYCQPNNYIESFANKYVCLDYKYILHTQFNNFAEPLDDKCLIYEYTTQNAVLQYYCKRCKYPYIKKNQYDKYCVEECNPGTTALYMNAFQGIGNYERQGDDLLCLPAVMDNVNISMGGQILKCYSSYYPVVTFDNHGPAYQNPLENTAQNYQGLNSPVSEYENITQCIKPINTGTAQIHFTGNIDQVTGDVANCQYYILVYTETITVVVDPQDPTLNVITVKQYYGCGRCKLNYHGKLITTNINGNTGTVEKEGYINECVTMSSCDDTHILNSISNYGGGLYKSYLGDRLNLATFFSCFHCKNGKIPALAIKFDKANLILDTYMPYFKNRLNSPYNDLTVGDGSGQLGYSNMCVEMHNINGDPQASSTIVTSVHTMTNNCALVLIDVNQGGVGATSSIDDPTFLGDIFCLACRPGYKATRFVFAGNPGFGVVSCDLITNCDIQNVDKNTWFNNCENCIHMFDIIENKIVFDECVSRNDLNIASCYSAYHVGPCLICQKGYDKDSNGDCVKTNVPRCSHPNYSKNYTLDGFFDINLQFQLYTFESELDGCSKCQNDTDVLVKLSSQPKDIFLTSRICTNRLTQSKLIISHCLNYGLDNNQYICKVCSGGSVLTLNHDCYQYPNNHNFANCELANEIDGLTCMKCKQNYLNVGGFCEMIIINNLIMISPVNNCLDLDHAQSKSSSFAICDKCISQYYKINNGAACDSIPIQNCSEFDSINKKCTKCIQDYFIVNLANNKTECLKIATNSGNPDFDNNCATLDSESFSKKELKCFECKSDYILSETSLPKQSSCTSVKSQVTLITDPCKNYDYIHDSNLVDPNLFKDLTFDCLECQNKSSFWFKESSRTCEQRSIVPNCSVYHDKTNKCKTCLVNYQLTNLNACDPLPGALPATDAVNKGYIQQCSIMPSCEPKKFYEGLHPHVSSLVSCHECIDQTKIPFVTVKTDVNLKIVSLLEYGFNPSSNNPFHTGSGESATTCLPPAKESFNITDANKWSFPNDCGVGLLNALLNADSSESTNQTLANVPNTHKVTVYCAACKPKYKATYTVDANDSKIKIGYMINTCTLITNCESSVWFNNCSQCDPNYAYVYDNDKGVQYDQCINYQENPKCYVLDNTDVNNKKCVFCKKGTIKNPDGICEVFVPPRCEIDQFQFRSHYSLKDLNTGLSLSNEGIGCLKCDQGFVGWYTHDRDIMSCTQSPYHTDSKVTNNSKYLNKCKNYKVEKGNFKCEICEENYVLTIFGKCVLDSNIKNCVLAFNNNFCKKCAKEFVLVDRKCETEKIDNCKDYGNNDQSFNQICVKCKFGFYLQNNVCKKGEIANCEEFITARECQRCKKEFGLVTRNNNEQYCYPLHKNTNCESVWSTDMKAGNLKCTKCVDNQKVISFDQSKFMKTVCMNFENISNCIKYDKKETIYFSSFVCLECDSTHYLADGECKGRTVEDKKCVEYSKVEDTCLECQSGFFLSGDGKTCTNYPEGIPNCLTYLSKTECLTCKKNYFLRNQVCLLIPEELRIPNCELNEDQQICSQCSTGYLIIDGYCVEAKAKDCETWETIYSCATCKDNTFGFKIEENMRNCVSKGITNCLDSEDWLPYACITCDTGFYPKEGVCTAVTTKVEDCAIYESDTHCQKCIKGSALSVDKLSCLKNATVLSVIDPNCEDSKLNEKPTCNTCKPGFIFSYNYCVQCSLNTLEDGCYSCDPKNHRKCLMCKSGYYMHDDGVCYKNGTQPPEETTEEPTDNTNTDGETDPDNTDGTDSGNTKGISFISSFIMMLMMIVLNQFN